MAKLIANAPYIVEEIKRKWAVDAAVDEFGVPVTVWRIAVRKTMIDGTRKEPLYAGSYAMVNRPCKVPHYTPIIIRKGGEETEGLYWACSRDYGLTELEMAMYEAITARMAHIREHCVFGNSRDVSREYKYFNILAVHQHRIHTRIVRNHLAWLRRRAVIATFAAANMPAVPAPATAVVKGE
jgi:hypothetical protein